MFLIWHLWFTTTNLSNTFPILETSATALCGTTGIDFHLDANNLFGLSMIQTVQYRNLEWDDKIPQEDIINYNNGSMGFILEVDVEYQRNYMIYIMITH